MPNSVEVVSRVRPQPLRTLQKSFHRTKNGLTDGGNAFSWNPSPSVNSESNFFIEFTKENVLTHADERRREKRESRFGIAEHIFRDFMDGVHVKENSKSKYLAA